MKNLPEIKPFYIFLLLCIGFILYKIPHLSLPYYWDEAWVYGKAVRMMAENGLSLLPDALPKDLGRGHPLLFHFLFAGFLKIFGNTIFVSHLFALIISLCVLVTVFFTAEKFAGKWAGVFSAAALTVQPIFLAQSCLVLPEMMLSLFLLLSLKFYLEEKNILFWIMSAMAIMVKESSLVLFAAVSVFEFLKFFSTTEKKLPGLIKKLFLCNSPLLVWGFFLLVQKKQLGYFFFPEHTRYISFGIKEIADKTERILFFTFIAQGRNALAVLFLLSVGIGLYTKKFNRKKISPFILLWIFIFLFVVFSSLNYFSNRYLLCLVPLYILAVAKPAFVAFEKFSIRTLALIAVTIPPIANLFTFQSNSDHDPGYVESVKVYQDVISFAKEKLKKEDTIYAYFNLRNDLSEHFPGYLEKKDLFQNVRPIYTDYCTYYIFSNVENDFEKELVLKQRKIILVKRFEEKMQWAEIWKREE